MATKVYVETSVVICASVGVKVGGKYLKHDKYDNTCSFLQYAEIFREKGLKVFYTTQTAISEANRVLEKALNTVIEYKLPTLAKRTAQYRKELAEKYFLFLNQCLDQMDYWLSFLELEPVDIRKKDEIASNLEEEFQNLDIEFRKKYGVWVLDFSFYFKSGLRNAAKYVRTIQRKEAFKEYKPYPGRIDISIMSEIIAINQAQMNDVYIVSEDGHFCSEKNRKLLAEKFTIKSCYPYEMLEDGLIRRIMESELKNRS